MKKKVLALMLALTMLIGVISMGVLPAAAEVDEGSGNALQMPTPQNVQATLIGFVVGDTGKAVVVEISWDALSDIDGGNKFVEMWPSLKEDANLSLPMSFEAWMGQATLIPVEEMQQGGIGYVTKDGRSILRSVVHILQPGELKVDDGMACGVKENDVVDIDLYTAGYDPATQMSGESEHKHVQIVYTEENVKNKKTFTEEGASECTHENTQTEGQVLNVKGDVTIDGKTTGVALVKETDECTDCHQKKTTKVYRLRFKSRVQMRRYLSGRYARLKSGKKVHFKGKYEKVEKVFWNKKHIKVSKAYNKKKGSVILDFTDDFLATVEDGIHELTVCNGDEFTAMTVTVQDHQMIELGAYDIDDHAEISAEQYTALMQDCEENGVEVVDCDLDEFYAGGFMVNADDKEVSMNLAGDTFIYTGEAITPPAVTLTSDMGVEYAADEDFSLTYYQVVDGVDGEPIEVEVDPEQIKDIGVYKVVALPTRNGVLSGEAWAQFVVIDEADCPHNWETLSDESGHWQHCTICGMSSRIQAHENWTVKSEIVHVSIPEEADFEESDLLCVTVYGECDDCGYHYPGTLYNVIYSYDESYYPLATLRGAEINNAGHSIRMKGDADKDDRVFLDGVLLLNPETGGRSNDYSKEDGEEGSIFLYFSDQYLDTVEDGEHELMVFNGDEFTVMTVTVTDHKMTAIKDKSLAGYEELSFEGYFDTVVNYFSAGADIINCYLDELVHLLGDVDNDGDVTIIDATCIQRKLASIPVDPFIEEAADTDGDDDLSVLDATHIQRFLAGLNCPKGIGQPITADPDDGERGSSKLVGAWAYQEDANFVYTFKADGTGTYQVYTDTLNFTYTDNGTSVTINFEDAPGTFAYTISGNTLTMKDSTGADVKYNKK